MTAHMLNWLDYGILIVIALSVLVSLARGFVREALSLITWVVAFWVAFTFFAVVADLLTNYIHTPSLRTIVAFITLFVITLLLGAFINYLVSQLVDKTGLSGTDRLLGIVFGVARGALLVTVLLMLASLTPLPQNPLWKNSVLLPYFQPLQVWLHGLLPKSVTEHLILTD